MMKKISFFLIALLILINGSLAAADTDLDYNVSYGCSWSLGPDRAFRLEAGAANPGVYGKVRYDYWKFDNEPVMHFFLAGQASGDTLGLTGGYGYPDFSPFDLEIALCIERDLRVRATGVDIKVKGTHQVNSSNFAVFSKFGTSGGSIGFAYSGEKRLVEKLHVLSSVGLDYGIQVKNGQEEISVALPAKLGAAYPLSDCTDLKVEVGTNLLEPGKTLAVTFAVETTFGIAHKPEVSEVPPVPEASEEVVEGIALEPLPTIVVTPTPAPTLPVATAPVELEPKPSSPVQPVLAPLEVELPVPVSEVSLPEQISPVFSSPIMEDEPLSLSILRVPVQIYTEEEQELIPLRKIVETLGGQVHWLEDNQQICIILNESRVLIDAPRRVMTCNGEEILAGVNLYWINGHYYLPANQVQVLLEEVETHHS